LLLLLNNTEEAFVLTDPEFRVVFFNDQFQQICITHLGRPIVKGNSALDQAEPERREIVKNIFNRVLCGELVEAELEYPGADGKLNYFHVRYKPAIGENGIIAGVFITVQNITQRKWSEQQLVFNERRFRSLVENSNDSIAILSKNVAFNYVSPSVFGILGYTPEEILQMDIMTLIHSEDVPQVEESLKIAMSNPGIRGDRYTVRVLHKNQSWRWIEFTLTDMLQDPAIGGIVDVFRDVTEKKQADEALGDSEEKTRLIMNAALDAIICMDINGFITFWNPQAERIFGWKAEEVMGRSLSETIIPAEYRASHERGLKAYARSGQGRIINSIRELSAINRNNVEFPVELTVLPIRQANEEFFCAFVRDITRRRKTEQQLKVSKERYDTIAKATNDVIYEWDIIRNVNYWGEGYETLFGHKRTGDRMPAETWSDNLHPEDKENIFASVYEAFEQKKTSLVRELRFRCADGSYKTVFDKLVIVYDQLGNPVRIVGAMQDITERKKHETAITNLNEELNKRADELAASNAELEQFAYVASHDLQEPLRMITSFLQLLDKKYENGLDETARQYIQFSVEGTERMKRLILDLLEYSRVNTAKEQRKAAGIGEIINQVLETYARNIQESKAIVKVSLMPVARVNNMQMTQLFQNLIGNALKYNRSEQPEIEIGYEEKCNSWQFFVRDNGIGIDPKFYERIFIIFQRLHTKNQFSGTGIGLAICRKIVEKHEGRIWVESVPGKGSTFYFTIKK
jgi:PAS domain S-box-containing protein